MTKKDGFKVIRRFIKAVLTIFKKFKELLNEELNIKIQMLYTKPNYVSQIFLAHLTESFNH